MTTVWEPFLNVATAKKGPGGAGAPEEVFPSQKYRVCEEGVISIYFLPLKP